MNERECLEFKEVLDALEDMVGQFAIFHSESNMYESGCLSACADAMRVLADHNRFVIVTQYMRNVQGYFPDYPPPAKP